MKRQKSNLEYELNIEVFIISRIFLIDDDKDIVELFEIYLESLGHDVIGKAFDGREAVEYYTKMANERQILPEIILLDHRMPKKDGMTVLKEILSINSKALIIFISADYTIKEQALQNGAIVFLEKPIDFSELQTVIEIHGEI